MGIRFFMIHGTVVDLEDDEPEDALNQVEAVLKNLNRPGWVRFGEGLFFSQNILAVCTFEEEESEAK